MHVKAKRYTVHILSFLNVSLVAGGRLWWYDSIGLTVSEFRLHPDGITDMKHTPDCQQSWGKRAEHTSHHQPVWEPKLKRYSWHPQSHLLERERCRSSEGSTLFLTLNMPSRHENFLPLIFPPPASDDVIRNAVTAEKKTSTLISLCFVCIFSLRESRSLYSTAC